MAAPSYMADRNLNVTDRQTDGRTHDLQSRNRAMHSIAVKSGREVKD